MKKAGGGRCTRREALRRVASAAGAVAAPFVASPWLLGREGGAAPGDRIALGFIGIGMMGQGHLRTLLGYPDVRVVAVCDVDTWRRENARESVDKAYAQAGGPAEGCGAHGDLRALLDRKDIDAVVIATGDNWHVPASILAARAGKDIYCEKPLSKTIREARALVQAVRRHDRVLQTGLQQRSTPDFRRACDLVQKGRIGKVTHVYVSFPGTNSDVTLPSDPVPDGLDWDLWLGPAPKRPYNSRFHSYGAPPRVVPWDFCRDFGGGNLTSNAVHAFDVAQWGLGMDESGPVKIVPPGAGDAPSLTYTYASGVQLIVDWKLDPERHFVPKGWNAETRIESFGALFVGEEGWIHVGRQGYLRSFPEEIVARQEAGPRPHPIPDHHHDWLACIRSRGRPACDVEIGCRSTIVSHLGCIAHWTGRPLSWDPAREEFLGDEEANRLRSRTMREPWAL